MSGKSVIQVLFVGIPSVETRLQTLVQKTLSARSSS